MSKTLQVNLAGFEFVAHKFNLGETEELVDLQAQMSSENVRQRLAAMRAILLLAARRDNPGLSEEAVKAIEASPSELTEAVIAIMQLNGYNAKPAGAAAPGEAKAEDRAA